jgi:hypothetical protein
MRTAVLKLFLIAFGAALPACATFVPPKEPVNARGPANVSPGGLNDEELKACDEVDGECRYFLAPCSMKEHSPLYREPGAAGPQAYMSLKAEAYMNQLEELPKRGYCQLPPRPMPADLYNRDTCIYVFIKKDKCE